MTDNDDECVTLLGAVAISQRMEENKQYGYNSPESKMEQEETAVYSSA